jgi:hypothetical protein
MFVRTAIAAALVLLPLAARANSAPPAPAPELKTTVDAFAGKWTLDVQITTPDGKAVKTPVAFDCKKTALGKAVACTMSGKVAGMGPIEASFLIGYDTTAKNVHFMGITSDEEVHDHKCMWKASTLECEPLKGGLGGEPITEDLSFTSAGKTMQFRSVTTMKDGSKLVFEGTGKRR